MSSPERAVPPVSRRSSPRFASRERRRELGAAFAEQGEEYDRLRPGYPQEAIEAILAGPGPSVGEAVDLGAGTGKLSLALAERGIRVTALDPSSRMLAALEHRAAERSAPGGPLPLAIRVGSAEATGLRAASTDLVSAAQAWHWFDTDAASAEADRILRPGGRLALIWNSLDVSVPWVHRYARILHAGDVMKDDFTPPVAPRFRLIRRRVHRWEDPRTPRELIDLARTRSYVVAARPEQRSRVLANLDWYVHEHLGHADGDVVGLPYRTDVFVLARTSEASPDGS